MNLILLSAFIGAFVVTLFSTISHIELYLMSMSVLLTSFLLHVFMFTQRRYHAIRAISRIFLYSMCAFLFGLFVSHWRINSLIDAQIKPEVEGQSIILRGMVVAATQSDNDFTRFIVDTDSIRSKSAIADINGRIRLSWRTDQQIKVGEQWQFTVRLRRPRGYVNPKNFDYQAWLLAQNVIATGYVKQGIMLNASATYNPNAFRARVIKDLDKQLAGLPTAPFIKALLVGDKQQITPSQWALLQQTGTVHLMAISGLHIGMVAGIVMMIMRVILKPLAFITPLMFVRSTVILASVGGAFFYSALAGFSIPTQRAFACITLLAITYLIGRRTHYFQILLMVACVVLYINPFVLTQPGFILSFGAVMVLIYAFSSRKTTRSRLSIFLFAQAVVSIGLFPLLLLFALPVSMISPVLNTLAIPLLSFVILPLLLLGFVVFLLDLNFSKFIFECVDYLIQFMLHVLRFFSEFNFVFSGLYTLSIANILWLIFAAILILSPSVLRFRLCGFILAGCIVTFSRQDDDALNVTILDVGQGLASVVHLDEHATIFDIGARFSDSFNIATDVLHPFLMVNGIQSADNLILSHADNDHAGALSPFLTMYSIDRLYTGEPEKLNLQHHHLCNTDKEVDTIEGLHYQFLWPISNGPQLEKPNNYSCVLLIEYQGYTFLFTGDIEREVEDYLLASGALPQDVDVLVAPHHGSATSSSPRFVEHVRPDHVIFSAGYNNRYHHPATKVVERYKKRGSSIWSTANHGAVSITVDKRVLRIEVERCRNMRRWYLNEGFCSH